MEKEGGKRGTVLASPSPFSPLDTYMSGKGTEPVKVRIIVSQFVQTDETQFKSVVQNLTGKDSVVGMEPAGTSGRPGAAGLRARTSGRNKRRGRGHGDAMPPAVACELERMIMGLPPLEELGGLWAD